MPLSKKKFISVLSPAKINLYLSVLGKRSDGFHEIETVFERVSLFDRIDIRPSSAGIHIECTDRRIPCDAGNLAFKAAALFFETTGIDPAIKIKIKKNIPIEAGLGGGSSNAAFTLIALNQFYGSKLTKNTLLRLASNIGSDCAFFVTNSSFAVGLGRGEKIRPIISSMKFWHVLVKPDYGVSTKEAYRALGGRAFLTAQKRDVNILKRALVKKDYRRICETMVNDLELTGLPVLKKILSLVDVFKRVGADGAMMSGSGSCVFALSLSRSKAIRLQRLIKKAYPHYQSWVVSTC